ncbi:GspE/PulE family protein [Spirochaeta isovalerica]|uniref:General secretion pathway protein E/type IV pilus assembly protein PilB n=1 Tax=Spirochaeta isovalerica TaxID=150 RepID=A0A841R3N3_9SPIO|nr:GspE/PulE family protein [Spirochaeta isovalerica]MBB6478485.1 general secretion pathway protein E/type IV pilus assembly protein PilB [Spirochaeta isovalerica]
MSRLVDFLPLPTGEQQYPLEYIETNSVIKLSENDNQVIIGMTGKNDRLEEDLRNFHDKPVIFQNLEKGEISSYLARHNSGNNGLSGSGNPDGDHAHSLDRLANDAPVINLVNSIIMDAIGKGASDIHIESFPERASVRFRVDGLLLKDREVEKNIFPALSSRIKIMANMNIMERRLPQDGRITVKMDSQDVDLRVSVVPITGGESIVLRLLNKRSRLLSLSELGFSRESIELIGTLYRRPHGLILMTGPTGSGKTTTLNSILREINDPAIKIITIEDPVEYEIDGVDQIQTNEKIGLTFESILRRVLRQDPDVIMIGEIRDRATAELAVRASMTGHLVFSTVHTNDSVSVLHRLINMGVEPYLLSGVLRGAIAQRLVRKLCVHCREESSADHLEQQLLKRMDIEAETLYRPVGCEKCSNSGFSGRLVISETFLSDEKLEDMITASVPTGDIRDYLNRKGMTALYKDGLIKASEGFTTIKEVEKAVLL